MLRICTILRDEYTTYKNYIKKKILYDSFEIFIYNLKGENLYIKKIG
jgi:hypothetical protein